MKETTINTFTGSQYIVRQIGDKFWLRGDNVPSPTSKKLPAEWWRIKPPVPWPPVPDCSVALISLYFDYPKSYSRRMPGGGKITSAVLTYVTVTREGRPS